MDYKEINFNKQNRRPVTDTTYQIAAEEWNALGVEIDRLGDDIENLEPGEEGIEMSYLDIVNKLGPI